MTDRQQKLVAYLTAIRPELEGSRNHAELLERIFKCIAEDGGFLVNGVAGMIKSLAIRYAERRADFALGQFSRFVEDLVSGKKRG